MKIDKITSDELLAAVATTRAVADAIRGLGAIPCAEPFAALQEYACIIDNLKNTGLVAEGDQHMLAWIGKPLDATSSQNFQ